MNKTKIRLFFNKNGHKYELKGQPLYFDIAKSILWCNRQSKIYKQKYL